ncbi:glucose dehydrogenase [FAD, quinone] [Rhipicephalus sanguineus]|uniref:glucose dehydrogenase [FAD, quinone] n=1 Tax=Rhipicephalus sanguineus TaxID=34632 RepID=UPI0018962DE5|nr:glucose dehydrogenase [FAD, quinone] [Rhipicephalus sanguineus]
MPPLTYIRFLIPKWPLFMLASVISILQLENSPDLSSYDTKDLFDSYDYVIVGAGTAGCVLANRLSADHHRTVLLIEAGGVENAATDIPLFALLHFHGEFDWDYRTEPQQHGCLGMKEHRCDWARGKALGGSSVTNFQLYVRGNKRDFDYWEQRHGAKGWSYKDVLPHFKKFESYKVPNANSEYRGFNGELPVTIPVTKTELQPAFLKAGEELGFKVVDYNAEDQTGFAPMQATVFEGRRWSSAKSFIRPVYKERAKNLHISLLSRATMVVFDNKRAVGVKFIKDGKEKTVKAKREVILSGGTIGSTQLLLLSGVGPKDDLNKLGIHVVADLPVGHNLQDHVFILGMAATTTKNVVVWPQTVTAATEYAVFKTGPFSLPAAIEATAFMNTSYGSREYPDFQLYLLSVSGASVEGERFITDLGVRQDIYDAYFKPKRGSSAFNIGIVMNRLKSRGYIKLRSKNYHDTPILDPRYYSHPDDPKMAAQAISQIVNLMKTKALAALGTKLWDVPLPPCKAHSMWSNEYNECMAKHLSPTSWHQCCTNPMGNGNNAVVDPRLR